MIQKISTPDQTNPAPNLYITPPEILRVVALVWLQLDEEPLLEVAGSRLDSLSQSQGIFCESKRVRLVFNWNIKIKSAILTSFKFCFGFIINFSVGFCESKRVKLVFNWNIWFKSAILISFKFCYGIIISFAVVKLTEGIF
jgi:hypothetical protein